MVLKVRNDMVLFEVARLERVDKHLVRLFRDSMVGHLHVCTLYMCTLFHKCGLLLSDI